MSQHLVSEEQVKQALRIDSFNNLSKEKIMEFASLLPNMDRDVAIAVINKFPVYVESSLNMIEQFNVMCNKVLQGNDESLKGAVHAYQKVLDELSTLLKQEGITKERQNEITEKMISIAEEIAALHKDNQEFLKDLIRYSGALIGGVIILGAVILGVKGVKFPEIPVKK